MVIIAGYTNDVEGWLRTSDPGMSSRFPRTNRVEFEKLAVDLLIEIAKAKVEDHGFTLHDSAHDTMRSCMQAVHDYDPPENGRGVRNTVEAMMQAHDARMADANDLDNVCITTEDIIAACPEAANPPPVQIAAVAAPAPAPLALPPPSESATQPATAAPTPSPADASAKRKRVADGSAAGSSQAGAVAANAEQVPPRADY